jgi:3-deoxy-D-manno-octulosonate 8-phosphate phosphatase (KDO 8-P phosphatase)
MTEIENLYAVLGGRFVSPETEIRRKLQKIKAFVFDWDGVFNSGQKTSTIGSSFSEVDSMGINLLRFSWFLRYGEMPVTAIISGEKNETAFYFSEREGFQYSFYKVPHKKAALDLLCEREQLTPDSVAYFFDDVLDIPIAQQCGIRILVNQRSAPLFLSYCLKHHLADYLTAAQGGQNAVREGAELLTGLNDNFNEVIQGRISNSEQYREYLALRKATKTQFFMLTANGMESILPER